MGIGAVLSQTDKNGHEHPIAFASRKVKPREQKYAVSKVAAPNEEQELKAWHAGLYHFIPSSTMTVIGLEFNIKVPMDCDHQTQPWRLKGEECDEAET